MKKILILGVSGMLGSMVFDYFDKHTKYNVKGSLRDKSVANYENNKDKLYIFDTNEDDIEKTIFSDYKPDYIINCIGLINKFCRDDNPEEVLRAIKLNAVFPYELAKAARKINAKIIQISTDCVFSGKKGSYLESDAHDALDVYGKTKSLGEVIGNNFLNIRCSVIGPELKNYTNLLEWFLRRSLGEKISGYGHHKWNGVTSLQFAKICQEIIDKGDDFFASLVKTSRVHHYIPNSSVTKYELLNIFNNIFNKEFIIERVDNFGLPIDRTLATEFRLLIDNDGLIPMEKSIQELYDYIKEVDFYYQNN
ncbi:MAG: SDR family oxidoreductase [Patescibacteria group bacterium]